MADDLAARLRAAIDETAEIARYAGGTGSWAVGECVDAEDGRTTEWEIVEDRYPVARVRGNMRANHVARQNPKVTLDRCAADRKILDLHELVKPDPTSAPHRFDYGCAICHYDRDYGHCGMGVCETLLALAGGYGIEP